MTCKGSLHNKESPPHPETQCHLSQEEPPNWRGFELEYGEEIQREDSKRSPLQMIQV